MPLLSPIPDRLTIANSVRDLVHRDWIRWFRELAIGINLSPQKVGRWDVTGQTGDVSQTHITPNVNRGLYRVSWYARVAQAATSSSSLQLTFYWDDGGVGMTHTAAAISGNTTSSFQSGAVLVNADADTTIDYSAAYSSSGATVMKYDLSVVVEEIK